MLKHHVALLPFDAFRLCCREPINIDQNEYFKRLVIGLPAKSDGSFHKNLGWHLLFLGYLVLSSSLTRF